MEKQHIRKRGAVKRKLTMISSKVDPLIEKFENDSSSLSSEEINSMRDYQNKLTLIDESFDEVQSTIEETCEEDQFDDQFKEREAFFEIMDRALNKVKFIISENDRVNKTKVKSDTGSRIQLPIINLPKFNGTYEGWLSFKDIFQSLVHSNDMIDDIQKYHYLRASLNDTTSKIIDSLEFSSENYLTSWELLCKRFDNKKLLINNHIKCLFNLPTLKKECSKSIRELVDSLFKHIGNLKNLGLHVDSWDPLLIYLITTKLDKVSACEWEKVKNNLDMPTLKEFTIFLTNRADLLESLEHNFENDKEKSVKDVKGKPVRSFLGKTSKSVKCFLCGEGHTLYNCAEFLKLSIPERITKVDELGLCQNCLYNNHTTDVCRSAPCVKCKEMHNKLLHTLNESVAFSSLTDSYVILSTVRVQIIDNDGNKHICHALLDSGSQSNFISKDLVSKLKLPQSNAHIAVTGINSVSHLNKQSKVLIQSMIRNCEMHLKCLILPKIADRLPNAPLNISGIKIPNNVQLADPDFNKPKRIDLIIGSSNFWECLEPHQIKLGKGYPVLQKTIFGYIVSGCLSTHQVHNSRSVNYFSTSENDELNSMLQRFWLVEESGKKQVFSSKDDLMCEENFKSTFSRNNSGRFVVKIPFRDDTSKLGDSKTIAIKRLLSQEKRFERNSGLRHEYNNFMKEYLELGHMSLVTDLSHDKVSYFLPHHAVLREDSLTSKIRVVFNGSSSSSSGYSLNDLQFVGPQILGSLFQILIKFRQFPFVVSSDITKMYRQILIHPDDRALQRIVWRFDQDNDIQVYNLNTVTYGLTSAPYLAMRCIQQLALDFQNQYPVASKIILEDFYVDDLITGFNSESEAVQICDDISKILTSGCFNLRKWRSNSTTILNHFKVQSNSPDVLTICDKDTKCLGIQWSSGSDEFSFQFSKPIVASRCTKRRVLSEISKVFDPLGLLSPAVIVCKRLIQKLWSLRLDWDDEIPDHLKDKWLAFQKDMTNLNSLHIPRFSLVLDPLKVQLFGFADASNRSYGAVIYLRSFNKKGETKVSLLCSKTKVSPLKPLTMPRLELLAALMLARLVKSVTECLTTITNCYLWSDSEIVLHWIHTEPFKLQQFVNTRIAEIQEITCNHKWNYVESKQNPADIASRGLFPSELKSSQLWWSGPGWLQDFNEKNYDFKFKPSLKEIPELKLSKDQYAFNSSNPDFDIFNKYSSLKKLVRVVAFCRRFYFNSSKKGTRLSDRLSPDEIQNSKDCLIKLSQRQSFSGEYNSLMNNNIRNVATRFKGLSAFIDEKGFIRVGGRLRLSNLSYDVKHPIILDSQHPLTSLIFHSEHIRLLLAGPQLLLSNVRQTYWPLKGMSLAKRIVRNCLKCFKFSPKSTSVIMGDLPECRVNSSFPFLSTGLDYAGPFNVKDRKTRGCKVSKAYVCLFICLSVKAIHLELVSDLTSEAFIACLRRFSSRRGFPSHIFSDNGTNFGGANNMLKEMYQFLQLNESSIVDYTDENNMRWHFIPPSSPHFGGIWEANVKSFKRHLSKVIGETILTFEEFGTLLTQIEAVLNSRPLYPLSSDPNDLTPLTPAHFLIGRPYQSVPDPDVTSIHLNRLSRYQLLQQLHQSFWKRWSRDYLTSLQQRKKWTTGSNNVSVGTMVIIRSDKCPPAKWDLGKIIELHPGGDGITRVVSVKTNKGVIKRPVVKLCPLPNMKKD